MTKKDLSLLKSILETLQRGDAFVMRPDVHLCKDTNMSDNLVYERRSDKKSIASFAKDCGSEYCLIQTGIHRLKGFIEAEESKK